MTTIEHIGDFSWALEASPGDHYNEQIFALSDLLATLTDHQLSHLVDVVNMARFDREQARRAAAAAHVHRWEAHKLDEM